MVVDFLFEAFAAHRHFVPQGCRRESEAQRSVTELHGGGETADEVAGELAIDRFDAQFVGEIAVVESPQGSLEVVVERSVRLHFK